MNKVIVGLVAALILATTVIAPSFAQNTVTCDKDYTVAAGDWLSKIASTALGDSKAYHALATQTNLKSETDFSYATIVNPDSIATGWKLCIPDAATAKAINGGNAPAGLDKTALGNAAYTTAINDTVPVTLTNGTYSNTPDPNSAEMTQIMLTDQIAWGAINGTPSAAVITGATGGGSGYFYDLHVMQVQNGKPVEIGVHSIGDRSPVIALAFEGDQVKVDFITQGPDQPFCCGSLRDLAHFKMVGTQLTVVDQKELGYLGPKGETPGSFTPTPTPAASVTPSATITPSETVSPTVEAGATPTATVAVSATSAIAPLLNHTWVWQGTTLGDGTKITPTDPTLYTLEFGDDFHVAVRADCNSAGGPYDANGTNLKIGQLISTLVACPPGSLDQKFLSELYGAGTYTVSADALTIRWATDASTMQFAAATVATSGTPAASATPAAATTPAATAANGDIAALMNGTWKWQGTTAKDGTKTTPNDPTKYTIAFGDDFHVTVQADCNSGGGPYDAEGSTLKIGQLITTLAACPDGSNGVEFMNSLTGSGIYTINGNNLTIVWGDGSTLQFSK